MSSVFKGIKKVFKKVFKAVKKLLPVVLAVGAIVFTGGAALGLTGAMGAGWAGAAASVSSALGATGAVGATLTGAIYQAGIGAAIGGTISKATGGSFTQGAKTGAITGAVTGGISGAYGHMKNAAAGVQQAGQQASGAVTTALPEATALEGGTYIDAAGNAISTEAASAAGQSIPNVQSAVVPAGGGGLFQKGGWIERNQDLVGGVVKGVGQGLVAGGEADAEKDLLQERQRIVSANYGGTDPGQNYTSAASSSGGLLPKDRFSGSYYGSFEYRYNPETARIERVPVGG